MFDEHFWDDYWNKNYTPWDMGYVSPPLKEYFDQIEDKSISILIPGVGNGWEAEYLWKKGFSNIDVVDISLLPLNNFRKRVSDFPDQKLKHSDFFEISKKYDLIIEHTFFCALHPSNRKKYIEHIRTILKPEGKLIGLLFIFPLDSAKTIPPYGGSIDEYRELFSAFNIKTLEPAYNSHHARMNNEAFIIVQNPETQL